MISDDVQREVLGLLAVPRGDPRWISQRKIAVLTCISRGSVTTIGNRGKVLHRRVGTKAFPAEKLGITHPQRCTTCGRKVRLPCRACRTKRNTLARNSPCEQIGLELEPDDARRYEQICRGKVAEERLELDRDAMEPDEQTPVEPLD